MTVYTFAIPHPIPLSIHQYYRYNLSKHPFLKTLYDSSFPQTLLTNSKTRAKTEFKKLTKKSHSYIYIYIFTPITFIRSQVSNAKRKNDDSTCNDADRTTTRLQITTIRDGVIVVVTLDGIRLMAGDGETLRIQIGTPRRLKTLGIRLRVVILNNKLLHHHHRTTTTTITHHGTQPQIKATGTTTTTTTTRLPHHLR